MKRDVKLALQVCHRQLRLFQTGHRRQLHGIAFLVDDLSFQREVVGQESDCRQQQEAGHEQCPFDVHRYIITLKTVFYCISSKIAKKTVPLHPENNDND
jgi:hypothetical protein